ncbi:hypothetical protein [Pseudoduganella sp. HUAS MS19]
MKNNIFDIFFGLTLALPIALILGAMPMLFNSHAHGATSAATFWTFVIAWPALSWRCVELRHLRKRRVENMLAACMLLFPLAAVAARFGLVEDRGGLAGSIDAIFNNVAGATTVVLGWSGAALAFATRRKLPAP